MHIIIDMLHSIIGNSASERLSAMPMVAQLISGSALTRIYIS